MEIAYISSSGVKCYDEYVWLGYTSQKYRRNTEIFEWILCILTLFYRRDILFLPLGSETIMDQQNRLSLLGWAVTKMLFLVQLGCNTDATTQNMF